MKKNHEKWWCVKIGEKIGIFMGEKVKNRYFLQGGVKKSSLYTFVYLHIELCIKFPTIFYFKIKR